MLNEIAVEIQKHILTYFERPHGIILNPITLVIILKEYPFPFQVTEAEALDLNFPLNAEIYGMRIYRTNDIETKKFKLIR